nr:hypothetical protein [Tanacetum cinerariifolium]
MSSSCSSYPPSSSPVLSNLSILDIYSFNGFILLFIQHFSSYNMGVLRVSIHGFGVSITTVVMVVDCGFSWKFVILTEGMRRDRGIHIWKVLAEHWKEAWDWLVEIRMVSRNLGQVAIGQASAERQREEELRIRQRQAEEQRRSYHIQQTLGLEDGSKKYYFENRKLQLTSDFQETLPLIAATGWWTYEFSSHKKLNQFHIDNGWVQIIIIGFTRAALYIDKGTEHELTPPSIYKKESVEHVEEVKDDEPVNQEELTPNDENDDTGVSQEDDKDVAIEPEVEEKDDIEAEEEPVEDNEADMEKETNHVEKRGSTMEEKMAETKADADKVELENEPLEMEKTHNEELKAEDDRQERLCFSDEEKEDIDEDELTDEKREEHEGRDARRHVVIENATKTLSKLTMEAKVHALNVDIKRT